LVLIKACPPSGFHFLASMDFNPGGNGHAHALGRQLLVNETGELDIKIGHPTRVE